MLNQYPENITDIVNALRQYHETGALSIPPALPPQGIYIEGENCIIDYGFGETQYGRLKVRRGQFELIEATNASNVFVPLQSYNHAGTAKTYQDYFDALKCNDLVPNQPYVSRMITLTSEASRSALVLAVLQRLMFYGPALNNYQLGGMDFCFKNYGHTAAYVGYDIQAGAEDWAPLTADNYLAYIDSPGYTGDVQRATDYIESLNAYVA